MRSLWTRDSSGNFFRAAAEQFNTVLFGGVCAKCKFCFIGNLGPKVPVLYSRDWVSLDQFAEAIDHLTLNREKPFAYHIAFDNSHSGILYKDGPWAVVSSKEIFDHPQVEKLLEILSTKTLNYPKVGIVNANTYKSSCRDLIQSDDYKFALNIISTNIDERAAVMTEQDPELGLKNAKALLEDNPNKVTSSFLAYLGNLDNFDRTIDYLQDHLQKSTVVCFTQLCYNKYSHKKMVELGIEADKTVAKAYDHFKKRFDGWQHLTLSGMFYNEAEHKMFSDWLNRSINEAITYFKENHIDLSDVAFIGKKEFFEAIGYAPDKSLNWLFFEDNYFGGNITSYVFHPFQDVYATIAKHRPFKHYVLSKEIRVKIRRLNTPYQQADAYLDTDFFGERADPQFNFHFF